jgi:hypothetical protein
VARSITGRKRTDHVKIPSLLYQAGLPSLNELAVRAVAIESWKANHSSDGKNGGRNPIGKFIFPATPTTSNIDSSIDSSRTTRSKTAGIIHNPLREANTFAVQAANVWNASLALREAPTRHAASAVAKLLAKSAPI